MACRFAFPVVYGIEENALWKAKKSRSVSRLLKKAAATIRRGNPFSGRENTVLVALSGGADSMALLHALPPFGGPPPLRAGEAAHVNHGLRAGEADRDEAFVRERHAVG